MHPRNSLNKTSTTDYYFSPANHQHFKDNQYACLLNKLTNLCQMFWVVSLNMISALHQKSYFHSQPN